MRWHFGKTPAFLYLHSHLQSSLQPGQFLSPEIVDEGVSGQGIGVHSGHTAVHIDPEGNVVTGKNRRLKVNHVTQEENVGLSWGLPVLYLKEEKKNKNKKSMEKAEQQLIEYIRAIKFMGK